MIVRLTLVAVLVIIPNGADAQLAVPPDRTAELMQLQLNTRNTHSPPGSIDGARATSIYKRFSGPAAHGGQAQPAAASAAGSNQP